MNFSLFFRTRWKLLLNSALNTDFKFVWWLCQVVVARGSDDTADGRHSAWHFVQQSLLCAIKPLFRRRCSLQWKPMLSKVSELRHTTALTVNESSFLKVLIRKPNLIMSNEKLLQWNNPILSPRRLHWQHIPIQWIVVLLDFKAHFQLLRWFDECNQFCRTKDTQFITNFKAVIVGSIVLKSFDSPQNAFCVFVCSDEKSTIDDTNKFENYFHFDCLMDFDETQTHHSTRINLICLRESLLLRK